MKLITVLLFVSVSVEAGFHLITTLYNEQNSERVQEYMQCVRNNLQHPDIDQVIILYDTKKDCDNSSKNYLYNFMKSLRHKKLKLLMIQGRPTYEECFAIANQFAPRTKIIISNGDIYFNHTLSLLLRYDLKNKFLALTRWNVQKDGSLKPYLVKNKPTEISQDTWIFEAPIRSFEQKNIPLGIPTCDSKIAFQAQQSGLTVINPCLTIQCCHLHQSDIRNYSNISANSFPSGRMKVAWTKL